MIGRLAGTLLSKHPPSLLIDVQGVGYEVDVPMSTAFNLPEVNAPVALLIHHAVREDGQFLYGFACEAERAAFRQLIKISGVGARIALAILSGLSVDELVNAISRQETGRLLKIPGIGKKTAERLLLELKDKLQNLGTSATFNAEPHANARQDHSSDIANALLALGYNEREATAAMKLLPVDVGVSDGIRQALKSLAKA